MLGAITGVLAVPRGSNTLRGGVFLVPVLLSESPNTFRGAVINQVQTDLAATPNAAYGQQIELVSIGTAATPNAAYGQQVHSVPVGLSHV